MIFQVIYGGVKNLKIIILATEKLSIPLDRSHRVIVGTSC